MPSHILAKLMFMDIDLLNFIGLALCIKLGTYAIYMCLYMHAYIYISLYNWDNGLFVIVLYRSFYTEILCRLQNRFLHM